MQMASAAGVCLGCGMRGVFAQNNSTRRRAEVDGKPVRVVDVHCHCVIPEALAVVAGTDIEKRFRASFDSKLNNPPMEKRLAAMDAAGVDIEAMSINEFWYGADRPLAEKLIDVQNEKLAEMCKASSGRLVGFASVALQFPELAAAQLEHGMKNLGLVGGAVGPTVEGEELSSPRFDPFWAKCEELDALIFMHPQDSAVATGVEKRVRGKGYLENTIGNPLETTIALSHLIFEGTFDRFPKLRLCAAHGGGYLASYIDRSDAVCATFPFRCKDVTLKKKPSEYIKQIYVDSIVFTPEAMRHLIATVGVGQVMIGTDYGFDWEKHPVDLVLNTPGISSADKIAILGGTASKLLRLPA
jgi:aminocarboxymuconate-semialdehyde decarboxylase